MINRDKQFVFGNLFFIDHQSKLLKLANSWIGRKILCIDGEKSSVGNNKVTDIRPNAITWKVGKEYSTEFRTHNKFSKRLFHAFKPVWYLIHFWDTIFANNFRPDLNFGFDTLTVFPDANPETSTVDGMVTRNNLDATWSNARNTADGGSAIPSGAEMYTVAERVSAGGNYAVYRSFTLFDTSALTTSATISSAVESLFNTTTNSGDGQAVLIQVSPASNTDLVVGDFDAMTINSPTEGASRVNPTANQYNDFTLNASGISWISKTGITKLGFRDSRDVDNTTPPNTPRQYREFITAENTGTSSDPKLVITYTVQSASPSLSPSASPSPSSSPSVSVSPSPSRSPSASASPSASVSLSPSLSPSASASPSSSVSASPSRSPSASASPSSSVSLSPSASLSPSSSASLSPSLSPSLSGSPSQSESRSVSLSPSASASPSSSDSPSPSSSQSPSSSISASVSPSASASPSPSATESFSPSQTPSASPSLSPSVSESRSPSTSVSASISPSQEPGEGLYSKEALVNLPTNNEDLAIMYGAEDEADVSTDNGVRVPIAGSTNYLAHEFKRVNNTNQDSVTVLVNMQTSIAPSVVPVYLQVWNENTDLWETIDTNNSSQANEDFDLTANITSNIANYYDSQYTVTFRVQQYINGVSASMSVDLVDICFTIVYSDKYSDQVTNYTDKFSDQSITYEDKYTTKRC